MHTHIERHRDTAACVTLEHTYTDTDTDTDACVMHVYTSCPWYRGVHPIDTYNHDLLCSVLDAVNADYRDMKEREHVCCRLFLFDIICTQQCFWTVIYWAFIFFLRSFYSKLSSGGCAPCLALSSFIDRSTQS